MSNPPGTVGDAEPPPPPPVPEPLEIPAWIILASVAFDKLVALPLTRIKPTNIAAPAVLMPSVKTSVDIAV